MAIGGAPRDARGPTRREFARTIAGLAAAPLLPACATIAAPPPRPAPAEAPSPAAVPDPSHLPETEILLQLVRARYGAHLTLEELEAVRLGIEGELRAAERMHRVRLDNGVAPDFPACLRDG